MRLVAPLIVDYFASRRLVVDYFTYAARPVASARHAALRVTHRRLLRLAQARRLLLRLHRASGCLGTSRDSSRGSSSTTSPSPRVRVPRHIAWLVIDYFDYASRPVASARRVARRTARRRLLRLRRVSGCLGTSRGSSCGLSSTTSPPPCVRVPRQVARLVVDYFDYAARPVASAQHAARRAAHRRLLRLRHASGCLGTSRGSSRNSSSTTLNTPCVRLLPHVARLVEPLVVDYSGSRRLVVDYFASAVRPGASARRAARHAARRAARRRLLCLSQAHRRLLRLRRASGCLGSSRGSSRRSSSTTPPRVGSSSTTSPPRLVAPLVIDYSTSRGLVVDYFASSTRPGASARRAAHHAARRATRHRLLRLAQAHRQLLRLCHASGCLDTSRGSSRSSLHRSSSTTPPRAGSSSTTSPSPRVRVPRLATRLVTRLVAPLVVDYSASRRLVVDDSAARGLVGD
jgi:hypothetical protein